MVTGKLPNGDFFVGVEDPSTEVGVILGSCQIMQFARINGKYYAFDQMRFSLDYEDITAIKEVCEAILENFTEEEWTFRRAQEFSAYEARHEARIAQRIEEERKKPFQPKKKATKRKNIARNEPGFVYLIWSDTLQLHKIGCSKNPTSRVSCIRREIKGKAKLVHKWKVENMQAAEKSLHLQFADKNEHGEWFSLSQSDVESLLLQDVG